MNWKMAIFASRAEDGSPGNWRKSDLPGKLWRLAGLSAGERLNKFAAWRDDHRFRISKLLI